MQVLPFSIAGVLLCMRDVKDVGLDIERDHKLLIDFYFIERGVFLIERGCGASQETQPNPLVRIFNAAVCLNPFVVFVAV